MNLPTEIFGNVAVVHAPEELGAEQAPALHRLLRRAGAIAIVLDLDGTESLDSAGLTALLDVQDRLRGRRRRPEDRHHQRRQSQDSGNHPPRPAARSVRKRDRRREEFSGLGTVDWGLGLGEQRQENNTDHVRSTHTRPEYPTALSPFASPQSLASMLTRRPATPRQSAASSKGISRSRRWSRRCRSSRRTPRGSCSARFWSSLNVCTEDQVVECLAAEYGVPYAKLEARLLRSEDRRPAAARVHREEPRAAAVSGPRHADGRRHRAVEPVSDRRDSRS